VLSRAGASEPGRLRLRLTLEKPVATDDGAGGRTIAWSAVASVWAEVTPLEAEEKPRGEGLIDLTLHRVVIRRRADVAVGDRFRRGDRTFVILALRDPAEDGRYLECLAEEEGRP
jgi:SPP1 family predicted phage head-tail adaptor